MGCLGRGRGESEPLWHLLDEGSVREVLSALLQIHLPNGMGFCPYDYSTTPQCVAVGVCVTHMNTPS